MKTDRTLFDCEPKLITLLLGSAATVLSADIRWTSGAVLLSLVMWLGQAVGLLSDGTESPEELKPHMLHRLRFLILRRYRTEVDLVIQDLLADVKEMRQAGRPENFIWCIVLWHSFWSLGAFAYDGILTLVKTLFPLLSKAKALAGSTTASSSAGASENATSES